jgi:hypothetical protein
MAGIAFTVLRRAIVASQGTHSLLKKAIGRDWKSRTSLALYACAVVLTLRAPRIAGLVYVLVAVMWLIPDRRIERALRE